MIYSNFSFQFRMKKKNSILVLLSCMALFSIFSCSTHDDIVIDEGNPDVLVTRAVEGSLDDMTEGEFDDEENDTDTGIHSTRSSFLWDATQKLYVPKWTSDDVVAVFSKEKGYLAFNLTSGENTSSAIFTGAGFELLEGKDYYSFSDNQVANNTTLGNATANVNRIHMTYKGQTQNGNGNSEHLGAFDYQAAAGTATSGNHVRFHYMHLGSIIRFVLTLPDNETEDNVTFTKLTLTDYNPSTGEKKFYQPHQIIDLTDSKEIGDSYTPHLESADLGSGETPEGVPFELALKTGEDEGITIKKTGSDAEKQLFLHMFIPAKALKGQQMKAVLESTSGKKYYVTFGATNFVGGKYYTVTKTLIPSGTIDIRLKVNPDWQLGDTQPKTRAQGDPGYDKGVHAPKYLYPCIVLDGVSDGAEAFHAFDAITTTAEDWTLNADGVYVYNKPLSYSYTGNATAGRVYAIASDYPLTLSASNESDLKGLTYSIPSDNSQDYLRNLYSTPLVTSAKVPFTGTVVGFEGGTPSADVTLYHVAAKVDVQWNSATQLPTTNSFVSVNDVKNTGLYYFKPTENALETGTYTVSEPITPGTMYNGRQVFYLPQFETPTYSITTGTGHTNSIQFTPSTTNGWTSWLKANINK